MKPQDSTFDRLAFEESLREGRRLLHQRELGEALDRLERAHRLGQGLTLPHVRVHVALLAWGWEQRDMREVMGQLVRIPYSALFTWLWVPSGNRGSTRVAAWRSEEK